MDLPKTDATASQNVGLLRVWLMNYRLSISVLVTGTGWLFLTITYGYLWVNNVLATETLYGYERSRLLISSAFVVYKLPYLVIALAVIIVLELTVVLYFEKKGMSNFRSICGSDPGVGYRERPGQTGAQPSRLLFSDDCKRDACAPIPVAAAPGTDLIGRIG